MVRREVGPEGGSDSETMLDTVDGVMESNAGFTDTAEPAAAGQNTGQGYRST